MFLLEFYDNLMLRDGPSIFNLDSLHFARTTGNTDYSHIFYLCYLGKTINNLA